MLVAVFLFGVVVMH